MPVYGFYASSKSGSSGKDEMKIFHNIPALLFELVLFLIVFVVCLLVTFNVFNIEPFQRGFFCDDRSIRYPYKDDTISSTEVAVIAILIFPGVVLLVEPIYVATRMMNTGVETRAVWKTVGKSIHSLVIIYLLGGALTQLFTTTIKLTMGRLRPNFFAWCIPDYNHTDCSTETGYVEEYFCRNNDTDAVEDVKKSFPSGHSSSAAYAFLYVAIYLDIRLRQQLKWRLYFRVIAPTVQTLLVIAGSYICVTRIQDNKHHPTDVFGGIVIGVIFSLITCLIWSRPSIREIEVLFQDTPTRKEPSDNLPQSGGSQLPIMQSPSVSTVHGQDNNGADVNIHF